MMETEVIGDIDNIKTIDLLNADNIRYSNYIKDSRMGKTACWPSSV
jgi:hypothetical protein